MSESELTTYTLRWRGRELGPYSLAQINQKLDEHEIGLTHEIRNEDKWLTLEEFLEGLKAKAAAAPPPAAQLPPFVTLASSVPTPVRQPGVPGPAQPSAALPNPSAPPTLSGLRPPSESADARPFGAPAPARPESSRMPVRIVLRPEEPAEASGAPRRRLIYAFLGICFGFLGVHNYYARQWLTGLLQFMLSVATWLLGFGIIASWLWALVEVLLVRRDGDGLEMK